MKTKRGIKGIQREHAVFGLEVVDLVHKLGILLPVPVQQDQRLPAPLFPIK